jgi:hypothetical protein
MLRDHGHAVIAIPVVAQTTSTKFGACDAASPIVPPETLPPPFIATIMLDKIEPKNQVSPMTPGPSRIPIPPSWPDNLWL